MFIQKAFNLLHKRCLVLLKVYDMSVLYHPCKANVVADALSRMTMCSVSHMEEDNNQLVRVVHRLSRLGVRLEDYENGSL